MENRQVVVVEARLAAAWRNPVSSVSAYELRAEQQARAMGC